MITTSIIVDDLRVIRIEGNVLITTKGFKETFH